MGKYKNKMTNWQIICVVLSIAVMVIIFLFSCENGDNSSDTSGFFSKLVTAVFIPDFDELSPEKQDEVMSTVHLIVRKLAHFSIYTALGFFVSEAFGKRKALSSGTGVSLFICFLYACSDEFHQSFVPGRCGAFTDVMIDTSGSLTGILVSLLFMFIIFKRKSSP